MLTSEKITLALLIGVVLLASLLTLVADSSVTREEAIEISRNTPIVQQALSHGGNPRVTADHWNATYTISLKQKYPNHEEFENLPEDHGVWRVFWIIFPPEEYILHFVDELRGQVLYEGAYYFG